MLLFCVDNIFCSFQWMWWRSILETCHYSEAAGLGVHCADPINGWYFQRLSCFFFNGIVMWNEWWNKLRLQNFGAKTSVEKDLDMDYGIDGQHVALGHLNISTHTIWQTEYNSPTECNMAICGNKMLTRCNRWFLLQILLLAQHVSGAIMPIIRSSRVLYKWLVPVVFGAWFSSCRYGVELRVVCPVCGLQPANRTFYFHILTTIHGQNHIKFKSNMATLLAGKMSSGSKFVPCGQTDGHDDVTSRFSQFRERA